ncbi:DPP IV N-terminal domain-containing protein [Hymenobacter cellulosilyticus]|uniref:DPP IV N-terminal domain-containing protein n=1 Tax=Hymenobacter cellulosilyticus TaxID=2932248 RepID=A0A8T9QEQ8_9BACT|nr:DPP IV N-terminal domain-containing protein [Hymenobacter cellulosilyticus]UOQ74648.1 DPP IV N-terminal domain-containing protein [Hymenobacter cellulosilyticus]
MLHFTSRLSFVLVLALVSQLPARAQQQRLTMEDAFLNRSLQPQNLRQLTWIPGSASYSYVRPNAFKGQDELVIGNAQSEKPTATVPLAFLNSALKAAGNNLEASSFPTVQWTKPNEFVLLSDHQAWRVEFASKSFQGEMGSGTSTSGPVPVRLFGYDSAAENVELDPTKTRVAYTKAQNLYISLPGRENEAVTQESNPGIVNGQAAHRSEFGITKGTFWSPQGQKLAFYRMDQTMVTDYPIVTVLPAPAQAVPIKYPMAGDKSHEVTVGVYDLNTRKTVFLQTGEPREQYLTNLSWSPDEKFIYVAVLNRAQNHMWLRQYDAASGALVKTLFEEQDDKTFVEPLHPVQFVPGHAGQFLWQTQRDGYNHLYLYSTSGKLLRQLTKGPWQVTDVLGFADNNREIVFQSTAASPLQRRIYSVKLSGGKVRELTPEAGTHTATLSPTATSCLTTSARPPHPALSGP